MFLLHRIFFCIMKTVYRTYVTIRPIHTQQEHPSTLDGICHKVYIIFQKNLENP